jgi:hypothetical protein
MEKQSLLSPASAAMHIARLVIENNKVTGEESLLLDKKERF